MTSPKAKLSPAQVRTLLEVVRMHKAGFRKFSCVPDYKPAVKLIELGLIKVETQTAYYGHMTLAPTPEGEFAAGLYGGAKSPNGTPTPAPSKA